MAKASSKLPRNTSFARQEISAPPRGAPKAAPNPKARNTVTVACKLPHGLVLRLFRVETYREQGRDGKFQDAQRAVEIEGSRITLKGANAALGDRPRLPVQMAYALTHDVPAEIWDAWLHENRDSDIVRNGLIFAAARSADAADQAKEQTKIRSGFEPIDRENPGAHQPGVEQGNRKAA